MCVSSETCASCAYLVIEQALFVKDGYTPAAPR